ncbi:MAG: ABC transporter ATP-binding protein [Chloroflexi bacterium]|nr:ABC transporter ATP-binding protein [Chloroflexota bacterium]MBU1752076.1 ABC transporter ATP-binding protein [Chloroflexota bacterium]MBU1879397.1 ABC transporter ATP-binding protein [Chloroflexota bacterium]
MTDSIIEARGLVKHYGANPALAGFDLLVPRGSLYGLVGPNGAGKTTTIHMLCGLTRPTGGVARVAGHDLGDMMGIRRAIGVTLENHPLYENLTAPEYLCFVGEMKGLTAGEARHEAARLLAAVQLGAGDRALINSFSKGMKQKVAIASAFVGRPSLVILDEPFTGIDPLGVRAVKDLLAGQVAGGGTVLLSSHILEVVERLCDGVTIIAAGRAVAAGPVAELTTGGRTLEDVFLAATTSGAPA